MINKEKKLRNTLRGNALFSFISGLILVIFPGQLALIMDLENPLPFTLIGIGLILFVSLIVFTLMAKTINYLLVKSIILQDLLWVFGSIILLIIDPFGISSTGYLLLFFIAIIVFCFALLQHKYAK